MFNIFYYQLYIQQISNFLFFVLSFSGYHNKQGDESINIFQTQGITDWNVSSLY